ncbi:MAG: sigma-70 family RNA polymerase sigma factor [Saprospiraceae bacterium]
MEITDQLLIECIQSGEAKKRDWALYQFYSDGSIRAWATNYIKSQGGKEEDAEDVFQEAICVFDRNLRQGRFEGKSTLKTYLISIVKWGWVTYRRKQDPLTELKFEQMNGTVESVEAQYFSQEKKNLVDKAIDALDERCQELLRYYKMDYSMKEIQTLLGFSSPEMAKKQAYRCRSRLRKVFIDNPALMEALNINI